jgi:outer membrane protein assembly factor BamB
VPTEAPSGRPVVEGGTCFVGTGDLYGQVGGRVLAVAADGSVAWRYDPGQGMAVDDLRVTDDVVYATSGTGQGPHGDDFAVHAIDRDTGDGLWTYAPDLSLKFLVFVGVTADAVVVGTHDDALGGSGEHLIALERDAGEERWRRPSGDVMGGFVGDGRAVVSTAGRSVTGYALADGEDVWADERTTAGGIEPRQFGERALVGDQTLRALSLDDGTAAWTYGEGHRVTSVRVADGVAYAGGGVVAALETDGSVTWTYEREGDVGDARLTSDALFATAGEEAYALRRADGTERWRRSLSVERYRPGAVVGGRLAGRTPGGNLLALETADGDRAWSWQPRTALGTPVAFDDTVVVSGETGVWGLAP